MDDRLDFDADLEKEHAHRPEAAPPGKAAPAAGPQQEDGAARQRLRQALQQMGFEASRAALSPESSLLRPDAGLLKPGEGPGKAGAGASAQSAKPAAKPAADAPAADAKGEVPGAADVTARAREGAEAARARSNPEAKPAAPQAGPDGQPAPPTPEQVLQQKVQETLQKWALSVVADASALAQVPALARQAQDALSRADLAGVDAARGALGSALTAFAALSRQRRDEMDALAARGADVKGLQDLWKTGYIVTLGTLLDPAYVANPFVLWSIQGRNGPIGMEGYRGGVPAAALTGDPVADVAAVMANAEALLARFRPILARVPEVRAWAAALDPAEADVHSGAAKAMVGGPLRGAVGRELQALQAVAIDAAPPEWAEVLRGGEAKASAQAQAEDLQRAAEGPGAVKTLDAARFAALDEAVRLLRLEAESSYVDDDKAMEALRVATTPAEKEYLLRRLRDLGVYNTLFHGLGESEQQVFEGYRADAGNYGTSLGAASRDTSAGRAAGQAARMLPGAAYAELVGAGQAIPILGDVIEKSWGEEARRTVLAIHQGMGVDRESAGLSASIATGAGKVASSIGYAAVGGPAAVAGKVGKLAQVEKIAGKVVSLADATYGVAQAAGGKKITGDEVSGFDRFAAGMGAAGGAVEGLGLLGKGVSKVASKFRGPRPPAPPGPSILQEVAAGRGARLGWDMDGGAKQYLDTATTTAGYTAPGYKAAGALEGSEASRAELARKSDAEVLDLAREWLKGSHGDPRWDLVRDMVDAGDAEGLRKHFGERLDASNKGTVGEQGLGLLATLLSPHAK